MKGGTLLEKVWMSKQSYPPPHPLELYEIPVPHPSQAGRVFELMHISCFAQDASLD